MSDTARRVATGASWLYGYRWFERALDFISVVVLARILSPDDFGLVAIAASFVTIIEGLSAFDVNKALIRHREDDRELYDTAWTLAALRGVASALIMVAIAPFLTDDRIAAVLYALALSPVLTGVANPRFVAFERDLVYSKLAVLTIGSKLLAFAVTLAIAIVYRSYWALVLGMLAGTLLSVILSYALRPYRPRICWARTSDIAAFSGWLSAATFVTTLAMETDKIIVGRLLGVAEAGLYFMTMRTGALPTRELISPLQRLLFPSFSEIARDRDRLRRAVAESMNVLGSLSLPAAFGFALVANDFVPLVLGEQWLTTVPLLCILVPYLGVRATVSMTLPCVMALGRTRLLARVSLVYALVHLPAFVAGTAYWGLTGSILSIVLAGALYIYLNLWLLQRCLGVSLGELSVQLRRPFIAAVTMVIAVLAANLIVPLDLFTATGSWWALIVKCVLGATVFCSTIYGLWYLEGRPTGIERRLRQLLTR